MLSRQIPSARFDEAAFFETSTTPGKGDEFGDWPGNSECHHVRMPAASMSSTGGDSPIA